MTCQDMAELLTMSVPGRNTNLASALYKLLPSAKRYKTAMSAMATTTAAQPALLVPSSSMVHPAATAEEAALAEAQATLVLADMVADMCSKLEAMGTTAAAATAAAGGQAAPAAAGSSRPNTRSQAAQRQPAAQQAPVGQDYVEALTPLKVGGRAAKVDTGPLLRAARAVSVAGTAMDCLSTCTVPMPGLWTCSGRPGAAGVS